MQPANPKRKSNRELIEYVTAQLEHDLNGDPWKNERKIYVHWPDANFRAGALEGLLIAENFIDPHVPKDLIVTKYTKMLGVIPVKDGYEHPVRWSLRKAHEYLKATQS